ncbi:MAG: ATP-binding protein [Candidatus Korarchaeota archaeon]
MNLEEIKSIVVAQREEIREKIERQRIIDREADKNRMRQYLSAPNILIISGMRRCGKSVFSRQILEGVPHGYLNFDDERLIDFSAKDFEKLMQAFYELYGDIEYIVLDEPQNIEGWELFVSRLRTTKRIIITGSNSKLLSGELASRLTGRYINFVLFPFSFREFLRYHNFTFEARDLHYTKKVAEIKRYLEDYIREGGLPEVYLFGRDLTIQIFSDILERDIISRLGIKKRAAFKELAKYLISNSSSEITFSKLGNILGIKDVNTIKNWIDGMEAAFLVKIVSRYSPKLKEHFIAPRKVYCNDLGIVNTIGFKISKNIGKLMENLVAIELFRRKSYYRQEWEIFYWKNHQQKEVDFVIKDGENILQLIQTTYASDTKEIEKREIDDLVRASSELKCNDLLIITHDCSDEIIADGKKIRLIPLWKWLITPPPLSPR